MTENPAIKQARRRCRRRTAEEREELLSSFRSSGLSAWAYARSKEITPTTFYKWLEKSPVGEIDAAPRFAKIEVSALSAEKPVDVYLSNGLCVRFGIDTHPEKAAKLIKVLQEV